MKHGFTSFFALLVLLSLGGLTRLQGQTLDPAFQATVLKFLTNPGLQTSPQLVVVQPDGKVLVGGGQDFVNGTYSGKIQRLNADGTTDTGFNPGGIGANGFLAAIVLQPDGKILIGGGFTTYNNAPVLTVARLNADGTLDASFSPTGISIVRQVGSMALQADGKILVGGSMSLQGGAPYGGVTRLNANGSLDTSFNLGTGVDSPGGFVRSVFVQADGKLLVGGSFTSFNGQPVGNLVRLNTNGTVDAGFAIGTGAAGAAGAAGGTVRAFAQQPDGKILVGGFFSALNGQPAANLARLLPGGALDNTFALGTGPNSTVFSLLLQSNGSVVAGGVFTQFNGQARNRLARVSSTGVLDATFAAGAGPAGPTPTFPATIFSLAQATNGQVLAAGGFTQFDGQARSGVVRLTAAGAVEPTFAPTAEARGTIGSVFPMANGQLLVSGNFTSVNGITAPNSFVKRLNANGSLDQTYTSTGGFLAPQPDGSFYGLATTGVNVFSLTRTLPSGQPDNAFAQVSITVAAGFGPAVNVTVQPDGRLLVYGNFPDYGGAPRNGITRLNANGTLDNAFTPPTSAVARRVTSAFVQASGKIVITYQEPANGAVSGNMLARLNANGTLDNTFTIGSGGGPNSFVTLLQQPDGRFLVTGPTSFNGQAAPFGIFRLGIDGAFDNTFNGLANSYALRAVQPDGRILAINGQFASTALVRLNTNGSLDNGFAPVSIPTSIFIGEDLLTGVVLQPTDSKILVFGSFRSVAGQLRIGLARLTNVGLATRAAAAALPLEVYPNPASQYLTVRLPVSAAPLQATLLDLTGRAVRRWTLPANTAPTTQLDLGTVAPGVYVLRIPAAAGVYQQKVVVTR